MTDTTGRWLASTLGVKEFLDVEASAGHAGRFSPVEELTAAVMAASLAGRPPVAVADQTLTLRHLHPSATGTVAELFDVAAQQARGAWWLPETALLKAGQLNLPAYLQAGPQWAANVAATDAAHVDLTANPQALACWALLIPFAQLLTVPFDLRGPKSGVLDPQARDAAWAESHDRYAELGLLTGLVPAALATLQPGNGWSRLTSSQQIAAKQTLIRALAEVVNATTVARWRATQLRPLLTRYYTKAKKGQPTARAVLTKGLQPTIAAFFAGDWLAFLDYLGEQPAVDEQIVTTLPETRLYVQASTKVEQIAAQKNLPVDEVARMLASYLGTDETRSPIEQRTALLRGYWQAFDAAHTTQSPGQPALIGLVGDAWMTPGDEVPFLEPASERLLPQRMLAQIESLWRGECAPRYPQRIVSTIYPHARVREALGPALNFWHEIALTAWFICEGPYARTDLRGLAEHYARHTEALAAAGTPVAPVLFTELTEAENRLSQPQPLVTHREHQTRPDGVTVEFSLTSGERRAGFEILRDIITRHRRAWAEQYLETVIRRAWEDQLRDTARELNRAIASRGKPPTVKQFARVAAPVANIWFGGDLTALYTALGEKAPDPQERIHLLPYDLTVFCNCLFHELGGTHVPDRFAGKDPAYADNWLMIRIVSQAPRFVQLEELLGRQPTAQEFRAQYYDWPQAVTFDQYAATIWRIRRALPKTRPVAVDGPQLPDMPVPSASTSASGSPKSRS